MPTSFVVESMRSFREVTVYFIQVQTTDTSGIGIVGDQFDKSLLITRSVLLLGFFVLCIEQVLCALCQLMHERGVPGSTP